MTNPLEDFLGGLGNALDKTLNPAPTDAAVYVRDGQLWMKLVYGDTSGMEINYPLPDKDLKSLQAGILSYLLEKK
jgi:hypothetical protein